MRKAVVVVRDGTINVDTKFCSRTKYFTLLPGAAEAVRLLNHAGFMVIVITNQSGIARGFFTTTMLEEVHRHMRILLFDEGARIDALYYCPHLPDDGCECHKPKAGLAMYAIEDFDIDVENSVVVGDNGSDMAVGKALGCLAIQVGDNPSRPGQKGDVRVKDILEAARLIIERDNGR